MNEQGLKLSPELGEKRADFVRFCSGLAELCESQEQNQADVKDLRKTVSPAHACTVEEIRFFLAANVVLDLFCQGWKISVTEEQVIVYPAGSKEFTSTKAAKEAIRRTHLLERNEQLSENAVVEFIRKMERLRLTKNGWHSIFSLMRDGRDLSCRLNDAELLLDDEERCSALRQIISPYLDFVESGKKCPHTGLLLQDVWRYFRHTWVNTYKSLPGRSIQILVRDAAVPNHPVIGIAALGSSVVQQSARDKWIGWGSETFVEHLRSVPNSKKAKWLFATLASLISFVYKKDLEETHICNLPDIEYPTDSVIKRLTAEAERSKEQHKRFPQKSDYRKLGLNSLKEVDWEAQAKSNLFRSKRCSTLAALLKIRKTFKDAGFTKPTKAELGKALKLASVREAIGQLARFKKGEYVGSHMMDIIVCGAVAPYGALLSGKLVCMLLCSPEVTNYYGERYASQISAIASSMRGVPVVKEPKLVFLGTTSLYGIGSSQYNRVRIPVLEIGGRDGEKIEYTRLGLSEGFGSYHLSKGTTELMNTLNAREQRGRRVNFIFGEGVNPRMRHIKQVLESLHLPSDQILNHGNKRVVYGVSLARNFREVLLGFEVKPSYFIPQSRGHKGTDLISAYWRKRWLSHRISRPGILKLVSEHTLLHPITHGARVSIPLSDDLENGLFS